MSRHSVPLSLSEVFIGASHLCKLSSARKVGGGSSQRRPVALCSRPSPPVLWQHARFLNKRHRFIGFSAQSQFTLVAHALDPVTTEVHGTSFVWLCLGYTAQATTSCKPVHRYAKAETEDARIKRLAVGSRSCHWGFYFFFLPSTEGGVCCVSSSLLDCHLWLTRMVESIVVCSL